MPKQWVAAGLGWGAVVVSCAAYAIACGSELPAPDSELEDAAAVEDDSGASASPDDASDGQVVVDAASFDADASDVSDALDADVPCSDGQMRCNGTGFDTCDDGVWVYRDCASGTTCKPFQGSILCDFE